MQAIKDTIRIFGIQQNKLTMIITDETTTMPKTGRLLLTDKQSYLRVAAAKKVSARWETWLAAVLFYKERFQTIKSFIFKLKQQNSEAIQRSHKLFLDHQVKRNIAEICENYAVGGKFLHTYKLVCYP